VPGGSGSTTCPEAQSTPRARRGLRCCHVPHGTEHATRQEKTLVSPRALRHYVHHSPGEGSSVAMCPKAPSLSTGRRRLWSRHVPRGSRPAPYAGRLWRRHVTEAQGPPPGRAPVSTRVLQLQTHLLVREGSEAAMCPVALGPRVYPCIPMMPDIRPIMALPSTRCMQRIKCVCDRPYTTYGRH
jgi:hypothetical protein